MTLDWLFRRLDQPAAPTPSVLAGVDTRPDGFASSSFIARRPLALAATAGLLLAAFALAPIDGLLVRPAPAGGAPKIRQREYIGMAPELRRCLYQVDRESWAVREECLPSDSAEGGADGVDPQGGAK